MATATSRKKVRSDAQRNREKIISVAAEIFSERGLNVSMDAIAKAAGVGAGTLYRHFSNRDALVSEVMEVQNYCLPSLDGAVNQAESYYEALRVWIDALFGWFRTYDDLAEPLLEASSGDYQSPLGIKCQNAIASMDILVRGAQKEGKVREGVTGETLYRAALGIAWSTQCMDDPREVFTLLERGWLVAK